MTKIFLAFIGTILLGVAIGWATFTFGKPYLSQMTPAPTPLATTKPTATPMLTPSPTASNSASPSASLTHPVKKITITGTNYRFTPNQIKVNLNDKVQIDFKNTQGLHNISIPAYNVFSAQISENQTAHVEFIADEKGTFQMYCDVEDHQQKGMVGNLIVE